MSPAPLQQASPLANPQQPADLLLYRLAKLSASSGRLVTRLCERQYGVTRREWGMLMWLAQEPGLQPSVLAERLELDRARVSRAIASLQDKGLLQKSPMAANRSGSALHLTALGQQLHDTLWPQIHAINVRLLDALKPDSITELDLSLAALQQQAQRLDVQSESAEHFPPRRAGSRRSSP